MMNKEEGELHVIFSKGNSKLTSIAHQPANSGSWNTPLLGSVTQLNHTKQLGLFTPEMLKQQKAAITYIHKHFKK